MFIHCKLVILILALSLDGRVVQTGEIFEGHEAKPHSRPYMVLLDEYKQNGKTGHCGGFLLNEDFVMTAAHCQAKSYTVLLGIHNMHNTTEAQRVTVEKAFPHKDYNPKGYRNDIMLLKLSSKANFNDKVKPIELAEENDRSLPKSCLLSGWGRTSMDNNLVSPVLMEVNVTLIDKQGCAQQNMYCSEGEAGPGPGDSGGPLVCEDGIAYGVVSACLKPNSGGPRICGYTKISVHNSWINLIIKNA